MVANAFQHLMKSSRKLAENQNNPPSKKRIKIAAVATSNERTPGKHFWKSGLTQAMNDSENIVESSDSLVIIKDKYPKVGL